jgi:GxxExxY protein
LCPDITHGPAEFRFRGAREEVELGEKRVDDITSDVLDAAIRIHRELGPGLFETVYETLLAARLERDGYRVSRQYSVDLIHDGIRFPAAFKVDILVDDRLVIEVKAVERLVALHRKQVLSYLRLLKQPVGLLINFNTTLLKDGFHRIENNHLS